MERQYDDCIISDEAALLQLDRICSLLAKSYWADTRSREAIARSIEHSLCFGVYRAGEQIGFARCVTDYATTFWLADVIIDERYRGKGLGKALVETILSHERLRGLSGLLATRDAHTLYARHGFAPVDPKYYMKKPSAEQQPERSDPAAAES